jgi:hypothetical protein
MLDYSSFFELTLDPSIRVVRLGRLYLPSGHVYCCDPFLSHEVNALEKTLSPGTFNVDLCVAALRDWGDRVVLARILLSTCKPVQWRKATFLIDGQSQSEFRVDAGLACFMDQETGELFARTVEEFHASHPDGNYYDDVLAAEFKQNAPAENYNRAGDWALHSPLTGDARNIAMFASGLGDGMYSAYWGLDDLSKPAMLVADFGMLTPDTQFDLGNTKA